MNYTRQPSRKRDLPPRDGGRWQNETSSLKLKSTNIHLSIFDPTYHTASIMNDSSSTPNDRGIARRRMRTMYDELGLGSLPSATHQHVESVYYSPSLVFLSPLAGPYARSAFCSKAAVSSRQIELSMSSAISTGRAWPSLAS